MGIGLCKNNQCIKNAECLRYNNNNGEVYLFENICHENNNYRWFWLRQPWHSTPTTDTPIDDSTPVESSTPTTEEGRSNM